MPSSGSTSRPPENHLQTSRDLGAPAQRGLRHQGRRHPEDHGLFRPLLRSHPQQHDQLRRHISGRVLEEQVFANRRVGVVPGPRRAISGRRAVRADHQDSVYQDIQLGYQIDLGQNISIEAIATKRKTRDVLEDYDLALYAYRDEGTTTPTPVPWTIPTRCSWVSTTLATTASPSPTSSSPPSTGETATTRASRPLPQANSNNWQALVLHVQRRIGEHQLRLQRGLPG